MNELTQPSGTGTANSPARLGVPGLGRYALNLNVLVFRIRELLVQFQWLTEPLSPDWLTPAELADLRRLFDATVLLEEGAARLEQQWRARQALSPKI